MPQRWIRWDTWWNRDGSRVHLLPIDEAGVQLNPGGRREYAADLPPNPLRADGLDPNGRQCRNITDVYRRPARIHQVRAGSC